MPRGSRGPSRGQFRSACSANGCVATAAGGDHADVSSLVFDNVGGRWLAVGIFACGLRQAH